MLERLWVLSLSAFEGFLSDLRTARLLIGHFPLTQPKDRSSLVNTGQQTFEPSCLNALESGDSWHHLHVPPEHSSYHP